MADQTLSYAPAAGRPQGLQRGIAILCMVVALLIATYSCVRLRRFGPEMIGLWRRSTPAEAWEVWDAIATGCALLTAILAFAAIATLGVLLRHGRAVKVAAILLFATGIATLARSAAELVTMYALTPPQGFAGVLWIIEPFLREFVNVVAAVGLALLLHRAGHTTHTAAEPNSVP